MSDIVKLKTQTQIDNEAALWTWRLDAGELPQAEQRQLEAWLREDARHRVAFKEVQRTWHLLDRLAPPAREEWSAAPERSGWRSAPRRWYRPAAAAAAAVLAAAIATGLWVSRRPGWQVLSTAIGQERHVRLADGSRLTLNTNTRLEVRFTRARREVYLRRGEAHFDVVHDPSRPFLVHAGSALIRDIGTQFEVRLRSDRDVDVLVDEGRVEVQGPPTAGQGTARSVARGETAGWARSLCAGERLIVAGPRLTVLTVSPRQLADALAWRQGALVFTSEPLSRAIAEVRRYTDARIVLQGPQVASLRVSGRFRTNDVPGFLEALQAALPVRVSRPRPGIVDIMAR
jgi:transmembrane sensor